MDTIETVIVTDTRIDEMIERLSETHDNVQDMVKKIQEQGDEAKKEIDQHYDEFVKK